MIGFNPPFDLQLTNKKEKYEIDVSFIDLAEKEQ